MHFYRVFFYKSRHNDQRESMIKKINIKARSGKRLLVIDQTKNIKEVAQR